MRTGKERMERAIDCLVVADRVLTLSGAGPWRLGAGGGELDLALAHRRLRVAKRGDAFEIEDLDGEGLFLRGERRPRQVAGCGDALAVGRAQLLVARLAEPGTVRWQGMLARARASLCQLGDIARAAGSRAPVFVAGESGTGKELAAHAIHAAGERRAGPFIALNCAALQDALAESELFGVERGAYTGALRSRTGAFVQAQGGTLFLDEIGELSPMVQAKLLRALEAGEVQPVGATRTVKTDVRVIAASWKDLEGEAELGRFRHDLLHRLCVLRVDLLPLRERREDILPIVRDLLRAHDALELVPDPVLARMLEAAPWHGNVREVRNGVQRAVAARDPMALLPRERSAHRPGEPFAVGPVARRAGGDFQLRHEERARDVLASTLARHRGNRKRSAKALGISRSTLYRWMEALAPRSRGQHLAGRVAAGPGDELQQPPWTTTRSTG
jgi:transcriptional regulator with PAS, ATPase and Fis domain